MTVFENITTMLSGTLSEAEMLVMFEAQAQQPLTVDDLVAGAQAMRDVMVPVELSGEPIDTCGTGGSGKKTINTSTLVAFIVAAAGGQVAKHGNRSASGNCGSFDLLEALEAQIELTPEQEQAVYTELGLVFLFAKVHHPAMRHVATARKAFGRKTIFNYLGPLCNPAGVSRQMIGTGNRDDAVLMAGALKGLGAKQGFVICGMDGLDEISPCSSSVIYDVCSDEKIHRVPADAGVSAADPTSIQGGTVADNLAFVQLIASGAERGPRRDLVVMNAAQALLLTPLVQTYADGVKLAQETIDSGKVQAIIERYYTCTQDITSFTST